MGFILPNTNTLIVHVPKTGGNWIRVALEELEIPHVRPEVKPGFCGHCTPHTCAEKYDNSMVFTRHPLDWYESWWKFQKGSWHEYGETYWHPQQHLEKHASDDFDTFVSGCLEHEPAYVTRMFEWYIGPEGAEFCESIGKLETIAEDFHRFMSGLGYKIDMDRLRSIEPSNVSTTAKPKWREDLREKALHLEQAAIRRFYGERSK